jgi:hypothetical protein
MTRVQDTSREAYVNTVLPTISDRQRFAYYELSKVSDYTNSELAARLGWAINRLVPRIHELRELGLVVESKRRECRVTGFQAIAWKINRGTLF